jgi:hypothetical protein
MLADISWKLKIKKYLMSVMNLFMSDLLMTLNESRRPSSYSIGEKPIYFFLYAHICIEFL